MNYYIDNSRSFMIKIYQSYQDNTSFKNSTTYLFIYKYLHKNMYYYIILYTICKFYYIPYPLHKYIHPLP